MKERAFTFGGDASMVGILSEPEQRAGADVPAVLVLNAGMVHRVGPFRMNVELARAFAAAGFPALRFDMTGLGDSPPRSDTHDLRDRVVRDVRTAIDHVVERGIAKRCVVIGLCSGAINAHFAAVADQRVAGAILLDGYVWATPRYKLNRYGSRLRDPVRVVRFLRRQVKSGIGRALIIAGRAVVQSHPQAPEGAGEIWLQEFPPRGEVENELRTVLDRGGRCFFLYTGTEYMNYREQLADCLPGVRFDQRAQVVHIPEADHTFAVLSDRRKMFALVTDWMRRSFAAP